jgi:hypothetical protein
MNVVLAAEGTYPDQFGGVSVAAREDATASAGCASR